MSNIIKRILEGKDIGALAESISRNLFAVGPTHSADMETAALLSIYHNEEFKKYESDILLYMGVFYKDASAKSLKGVIFEQYKAYIAEKYNNQYTPIQSKIARSIDETKCFSFSAPTSTGKSFVFLQKIMESTGDVVIVVPSRSLINEYFIKISDALPDKTINILTFIDKINTRTARRTIFVVTPERCRDLFKRKKEFSVEFFLFDEAQLGNEDSRRGIYYDSIIRRCNKSFPDAKFVFAHPFVENPEAQIKKNHFEPETSRSKQFNQRNVGQTFMCKDEEWNYYHFGIDKDILGKTKVRCEFDPIQNIIARNGTALFYVAKSRILNGEFQRDFSRYIDLCHEIESEEVDQYIEEIRSMTGGETHSRNGRFSRMLSLLKRGIVIHHGSIPLQTRVVLEKFTKAGFCRLCFATSTLEQGINMPFDAVYVDRLEKSKPLAVKNLIGRAGRSTCSESFDYGIVVLGAITQMTPFRKIMSGKEMLKDVSDLERSGGDDEDTEDFKKSILNGTFSDEYNMTPAELAKLESKDTARVIKRILDSTMVGASPIPLEAINRDISNRLELYSHFSQLYSNFLGRPIEPGEGNILNTAIKIMLWRVYGRSFKNICWFRFSYASRYQQREALENGNGNPAILSANFITGYQEIPNKYLPVFPLFPAGTRAVDVDYDTIMYDTYDFIDKLIGFKLSDIFYAAFMKYYEKTADIRASILANFVRYGTNDEKLIWLLRYGLSFEEIDSIEPHVSSIDETGISFRNSISTLTDQQRKSISRFEP